MLFKKPILLAPSQHVDLLVIAGEHSGDEQAARLVAELHQSQPQLKIAAFGGPKLAEVGAFLSYDMTSSSVVGFVEVVRHYPFFKELFEKMLAWVECYQPKHILFVDYPGFNLRFAKALFKKGLSKKAGGNIGLSYYISPQIWAWKAKRRFAMARYLDQLGVIFPFEVACFKDTTLPVTFVGHPFMRPDYQQPLRYNPAGDFLFLPGSRKAAVKRILPRMLEGYALFLKTHPPRAVQLLYPSAKMKGVLEAVLAGYPDLAPHIRLLSREEVAVLEASAVLTSSGTMSLTCALAAIPGAIVYHTSIFTYYLARSLVKVRYLGMANLLLNEAVYPEYIQQATSPKNLSAELTAALDKPARIAAVVEASQRLRQALGAQLNPPSAASWLAQSMGLG